MPVVRLLFFLSKDFHRGTFGLAYTVVELPIYAPSTVRLLLFAASGATGYLQNSPRRL